MPLLGGYTLKKLIVMLGVVGTSLSAIFARWSTAPSLVLVFYRMIFSAVLLLPVMISCRQEFSRLRPREGALCLLSGLFLGLHLTCYFESLRFTSIASSVVLVDTEVLFVALAMRLIFHRPLGRRAWLAILLAFGGSVAVALADGSTGGAAVVKGDMIALAGAFFMAVYTMLGAVCRRHISTTVYTSLVYLAAAGTVLCITLASGQPVAGYGPVNLLTALGLAVFCTLLGHSIFSWGLKYFSPAFISTVKLLSAVFSVVWGILLFREVPGALVVFGSAFVLAGIALYCSLDSESSS